MTSAFVTLSEASIVYSPSGALTFPVKILSGAFSYLPQIYNAATIKKIIIRVTAVCIFFIIILSYNIFCHSGRYNRVSITAESFFIIPRLLIFEFIFFKFLILASILLIQAAGEEKSDFSRLDLNKIPFPLVLDSLYLVPKYHIPLHSLTVKHFLIIS